MAQGNVEIVKRVYAAINRALVEGTEPNRVTLEQLRALFDPEVEIRQMDDIAGTAGTFRGYAGLAQAAAELMADLLDIQFTANEYFEVSDTVVADATAAAKGRESGVPIKIRVGHLWQLRDGRVVRWVVHRNLEEALEAAGLGGGA